MKSRRRVNSTVRRLLVAPNIRLANVNDELMRRAKARLAILLWRWLLPMALAIPMIALYVAWRKWGGWLWPTLLISTIIFVMAVGVWDLSRPWDDD
jgi:hypothetical protein